MKSIIKRWIAENYSNIRGWSFSKPLIVIESDDWGASRIRTIETLEYLLKCGLQLDAYGYDRLDALENRDDLELLFDVIEKNSTTNGHSPRFTTNMVLGNPDFELIEENDFERYEFESSFSTYERYYGEKLDDTWSWAIDAGIVHPQFHGREHLNVPLWMRDLRAGHTQTRLAFDAGYYGLTTQTSARGRTNYLAAFWPDDVNDLEEIAGILSEGLQNFETTFGFKSKTFIPCNYVLPAELEKTAYEHGVRLIQGQRGQLVPRVDGRKAKIRRSYTGQKTKLGQRYSVRNVKFEPFEDENHDWVGSALAEIDRAFRHRTPAIISTHRVNYVSGMSVTHRDRSLRLLDELLGKVIRHWPEVEFITSDSLSEMMTL